MTIEQELLTELSDKVTERFKYYTETYDYEPELTFLAKLAAETMINSGLVIPVSALDGMMEKVAIAIDGEIYDDTHIDRNILAQAAIKAIKEEIRK